jgi:hypothetical protein
LRFWTSPVLSLVQAKEEEEARDRLRVLELAEVLLELGDRPLYELEVLVVLRARNAALDTLREEDVHRSSQKPGDVKNAPSFDHRPPRSPASSASSRFAAASGSSPGSIVPAGSSSNRRRAGSRN